jgi:uncharacterized membrane protein
MDDLFFALLGLALIGVFFAPLVLALVAMSRTSALKRNLARLEARFDQVSRSAPAPAQEAAPLEPETAAPETAALETAAPETVIAPEPSREEVMVAPATGPAAPRSRQRRGQAIEEKLTSRWLVWLGAVALVFAGIFLVKYSIDNALLTPAMRIILGLALGIALTAAGEWLRRRPLERKIAATGSSYVPGALTSAGLFISFASIYGAYSLFELISPATAFIGLALVALVAFALAALHSPIVAIIGLLAGYATPALIESETPNAALLFGYLALIGAAAYAVVLYRAWGWLAYGVLAGSLIWVALWILRPLAAADLLVLGLFLAALTAASLWLALTLTPRDAPTLWQDPKRQGQGPELNGWMAATGSALLFAWGVTEAGTPLFGIGLAALGTLALALAARSWQRFDGLIVHASLLLSLTFLGWDAGEIVAAIAKSSEAGNIIASSGGLIARGAETFTFAHFLAAALIAILGFILLRGALRPFIFAGASILATAVILAGAYVRINIVTADTLWALVSAGSAALAVVAVGALNRRREERAYRLSLAFYAAASVAGVAFTCAFTFRDAWLTVALSLQLPALAWLEKRLDLTELRALALAIAAAVLIRLALNPYVLGYDATYVLGSQWVLYGYGIPAACFYAGALLFRERADDRTVLVLESGALAFALLLIGLEFRILVEGRIAAPRLTLFELSLDTVVWLAVGWWRARAYRLRPHILDVWWSAVLIGLGLSGVIFGQLLVLNPVITGEPVGTYPILNELLAAYLAPAVLIALLAREVRYFEPIRQGYAILSGAALILMMVWLTLETKHAFEGPQLTRFAQSDAEYYAYSVVWLISAFVLLGFGIWRGTAWLRHGALAILIITVLKVFLSDMAALGGLYRVASFLGLGLCLVGIGYLYQRFVFTGRGEPEDAGEALAD